MTTPSAGVVASIPKPDLQRVVDVSSRDLLRALRRPPRPDTVGVKLQYTTDHGGGVIYYVTASFVFDLLNRVCALDWALQFSSVDSGLMWCHMTVCGVTRSNVGEGEGKALVSDSIKRAATCFGIGIALNSVPQLFLTKERGDVKAVRTSLVLTQQGEKSARAHYERWLVGQGRAQFGEPLELGWRQPPVIDKTKEQTK
jgi:hypothetical protein